MTPDDPSSSDDEGPITPEVVGDGPASSGPRGAAGRKRRVGPGGPVPDAGAAPGPARTQIGRPGRMVKTGCAVLGLLGVFGMVQGVRLVSDPADAQCAQARFDLEQDANDAVDDDERREGDRLTDAGRDARIEEIGGLECAVVLAQAQAILDEDEDLVSESTIRTFGLLIMGVGIAQAASGLLTARTFNRRARMVALASAAFGIFLSPIGQLAILPIGFIIFALYFSRDAKAIFGSTQRPPTLMGRRRLGGS